MLARYGGGGRTCPTVLTTLKGLDVAKLGRNLEDKLDYYVINIC
jgi:hypothetical protein